SSVDGELWLEELFRHGALYPSNFKSSPREAEFQKGACSLAHAQSHQRLAPSLPTHGRQHLAHDVLSVDQLRSNRRYTGGKSLPHPSAYARRSYPEMLGRGTDLTEA